MADPLRKTVAASERERRRWARELHDETLQRLGAMRLRLAAARRGPEAALGPAVEDAIAELAEEITELRSLIAELSPVALEELGLEAALESLAYHHRVESGLEVTVDLSHWRGGEGPVRLDPELESTLYRVVQEALTNVVAHAHATRVDLRLQPIDRRGGGERGRRRARNRPAGSQHGPRPGRARRAPLARRRRAHDRVLAR